MANLSDNLHFDISTSVIKQLGEQLISDEVTAIMELIKNSYDAEADWVKIDIEVNNKLSSDYHYNNTEGYIILEDNGEGMSLSDINNRWLIISFSAKREQKEQGVFNENKRIPLGDKGLGRLSTQRIGKQIEIITGVENENIYHCLAYNWDDFDGKRKLSDVNVIYKTIPKKIGIKGTKVAITALNNPNIWKGESFDIFRSELSKMLFPVKNERPFNIRLSISGQKRDLDILNDQLKKTSIGEYDLDFNGKELKIGIKIKLAKLKGNKENDASFYEKNILVDSGKSFFNFLTDNKTNKRESLDATKAQFSNTKGVFIDYSNTYNFDDIAKSLVIDGDILVKANPGIFKGEIYEYDIRGADIEFDNIDVNDLDSIKSLSEYKTLVKNQVGVRIFRDGFGVKPYGLNSNDWLQLASGQTSGGSFYGLRPHNIIGYISISNRNNSVLSEKTDREGFIETPYSQNFFLITKKFIKEINDVLESVRRGLNSYKLHLADNDGNFNGSTNKAIDGVKKVSLEAKKIKEPLKEISGEIIKKANEYNSQLKNPLFNQDKSPSEQKMLRETAMLLTKVENELSVVGKALESASKLDINTDFISPQIDILKRQLSDFSELASLGLTAEVWSHEILNILDRISSQTNNIEKRLKSSKEADTAFFIYVEYVKSVINNLRIQVNHFSPSLKYNREKKHEINVASFVNETKEFFSPKIERIGGKIEVIIKDDFNIKVNKGKLTQVFDNLLFNSEYWLKQKTQTNKTFIPQISIEISNPIIKVWDNGNGISEAVEGMVFQPFVTAKPVGEGRGLGLYIVEQIMESIGGEIILLSQRNIENRRYIFQINLESTKI